MSNPLVTFLVLAYSQERFIREAVQGAFAQTCSPLEIILSDDCSPDRTFEIMQEMAAAYTGPHKIVLNRNPKNLGVGNHVNRLMGLAHGALIVVGAGDDISMSNRVTELESYWSAHGRFVGSLYSAAIEMDAEGKTLYRSGQPPPHYLSLQAAVLDSCQGIHGATHAWHRDIFWTFGPFNEDLIAEDRAFALRAMTIGQVHYLDQPLVRYRRHAANIYSVRDVRDANEVTLNEIRDQNLRKIKFEMNMFHQFAADLARLRTTRKQPENEVDAAAEAVVRKLKLLQAQKDFELAGAFEKPGLALKFLLRGEVGCRRSCRFLLRAICPPLEAWNRRRQRRVEARARMLREAVSR